MGATGADGGNILLANDTLPATINGSTLFQFPLVGASAPTSFQGATVLLPNACNTQTLSATALNAPGTSTATLDLTIGFPNSNGVTVYHSFTMCRITANGGQDASCTGSQGINLAGYGTNSIALSVSADAGFEGANLLTKFTCTP